jgi:subtilisin family serine protease
VSVLAAAFAGRADASEPGALPTGFDWRGAVAASEAFEPLLDKARAEGTIRVIVGLQVQWSAEPPRSGAERDHGAEELTAARDALLASLPEGEYQVARTYRRLPLVALELSAAGVEALRRGGRVPTIEEDGLNDPELAETVPIVEANEAVALGMSGKDHVVAVLDTGVDPNHPFLAGRVLPGACFSFTSCPSGASLEFGPGAGAPCPYPMPNTNACQHGTHVAGIVAGNGDGVAGAPGDGVAPGTQIVPVQVFHLQADNSCTDPNGPSDFPCLKAFDSDVIAGLDFVDWTSDVYPYAAVNLSLASADTFPNQCANVGYLAATIALMAKGIPIVVSSGNGGAKTGLSSPACQGGVVSVGNTQDDDVVNSTSNSASYLTLLAPGTNVTSSQDGGFVALTGTSMAAPHVAGAFAILRDRFPGADLGTLVHALIASGLPVTDTNGVTTPRIRILTALASLGDWGLDKAYTEALDGGRIFSEGTGLRRLAAGGQPLPITIAGIPFGAKVKNAYLYYMTAGGADIDSRVTFAGGSVPAVLFGASRPLCKGYGSSGATRTYRADVSALVPGNGTYTVGGVGVTATGVPLGASLVVVVRQPGLPLKRIVINHGAMTAPPGEQMAHSFALVSSPIKEVELHVGLGDGDGGTETSMSLGGSTMITANAFSGSDGSSWDDRTAVMKGVSTAGLTAANSITSGTDCLAWAYAAITYAT